ncbi:MAG: hypothetical protein WBQ69_02865 [Gallionella sp.]
MQELLNNPAVQAGFAPFLVALITAGLFQRVKLSGLAIIAGFAVTVYLASDFTIAPLTASRKIVLLGLASASLGLLLTLLKSRWLVSLLPLLGAAAAIWTALRILQQQPLHAVLLWGAGCAAYTAILVWGMDRLENDPLRAASAATALGMGTGGAALVGASALLGQFGLALGSAAAAYMLIHMLGNRLLPTGRVFTLPLGLIAGLTGCIGTLSATLPWYALPILAAIPLSAWLIPLPGKSLRLQTLLSSIPAFALAAGAVYVTWRAAGDVPF